MGEQQQWRLFKRGCVLEEVPKISDCLHDTLPPSACSRDFRLFKVQPGSGTCETSLFESSPCLFDETCCLPPGGFAKTIRLQQSAPNRALEIVIAFKGSLRFAREFERFSSIARKRPRFSHHKVRPMPDGIFAIPYGIQNRVFGKRKSFLDLPKNERALSLPGQHIDPPTDIARLRKRDFGRAVQVKGFGGVALNSEDTRLGVL